jgi:polycomb group RING finger protein 3
MIPSKKLNLDLINEHLICRLCSGYLIDAWTINECLHSFCRPCIFSYFDDNEEHTTCPTCSTIPHPANPLLGVTKDCWLQQIVYKLVPSLFKREMRQRRIYYDANPENKFKLIDQYTKTHSSQMGCREEELGELSERCLFQQKNKLNHKEKLYITLENDFKIEEKDFLSKSHLHFIECSSTMPINILKQYLKKILPLSKRSHYQIDILFDQKILLDNFTLNHIYLWKQMKQEKQKQLHLFYRVIIIKQEANDPTDKSPIEHENNILQPVTTNIVNSITPCENQVNTVS